MDGDGQPPLFQYEAAMRDAGEFLRRRDLGSYEEIPLYFAWERLYATRNKNLSVDFLRETPAESLDRKQARLAPRQGLPPSRTSRKAEAWTTLDAPLRKSLLSSSFLRSSEVLSPAAVDAIAQKYRWQAAKHRVARADSLFDSIVADAGEVGSSSSRRKKSRKSRLKRAFEAPLDTETATRQTEGASSYQYHEEAEDGHLNEGVGEQEPFETDEGDGHESPLREESVAKVTPIDVAIPSGMGRAASVLATKAAAPRSSGSASTVAVNYAQLPDASVVPKPQGDAGKNLPDAAGPASAVENGMTSALLSKLFQYVHVDAASETDLRGNEYTKPTSGKPKGSNGSLTSSQVQSAASRRPTGVMTADPVDGGRRVSRRHNGGAVADDIIDEGDEWEEDEADLSSAAVDIGKRRVSSLGMKLTSGHVKYRPRSRRPERYTPFARSESDVSSEDDASDNRMPRRHVKTSKLDEILWPPGMEEAVTKVRFPRFGAIRPVGLESLKTEEEWRDYWVWLHWYSLRQVWYLNNDIPQSKARRKDRRGDNQTPASKTTSYRKPAKVNR